MMRQLPVVEKEQSLTETLFSLDEPWRGRFLDIVMVSATGQSWNLERDLPSPEEVTTWLGNRAVYENVTRLLHAWRNT